VLEILVEAHAVAAAEAALERGDVAGHRVQDAAVLLHPLHALFHGAGPAEHALEHHARIGLERDRLRRRFPRQRVHVGAAVAHVARAYVAGEVLGTDLERGEDRVLPDLVGDDLVQRGAVQEVLGLGALGLAAGQKRAGADGVGALLRTVEVGDHVHVIAELLDRLQDGAELEALARCRRGPVARTLAHRHEDRAEALDGRRGCQRRARQRRYHRVEQRQGQRGAQTPQNGSA
jgi:hypothetical protein